MRDFLKLVGIFADLMPFIIDWFKKAPERKVINLHEKERKQKDRKPSDRKQLNAFFDRLRK